jgi:predicted transcriptional regulator of viral defense system
MKRTVLTRPQLDVLEQIIAQVGQIVTFAQIVPFLPVATPAQQRRFVHQLVQAGWLVRIKKGLYQVADLSSLGTLTLSPYTVAQLLAPESYVSFEAALQYHGLFDQLLNGTLSVSLRQYPTVELQGFAYQYVKTTQKYFYGWQEQPLDGRMVKIAAPEKALIDMIQYHRTEYTADVVLEKLQAYQETLDFAVLQTYLLRANLTTQRIFGFFLDALQMDSTPLWRAARQSPAVSKLTPDSPAYNAKWRLYYEPALIQ